MLTAQGHGKVPGSSGEVYGGERKPQKAHLSSSNFFSFFFRPHTRLQIPTGGDGLNNTDWLFFLNNMFVCALCAGSCERRESVPATEAEGERWAYCTTSGRVGKKLYRFITCKFHNHLRKVSWSLYCHWESLILCICLTVGFRVLSFSQGSH